MTALWDDLLFLPTYWLRSWDFERTHNLSGVIAKTCGRAEVQGQISWNPEPNAIITEWCGFVPLQGKDILGKWWHFLGYFFIEEQKFLSTNGSISVSLKRGKLLPVQFKKILAQRSNWTDLSLSETMTLLFPKEREWNEPFEYSFVGRLILWNE